jgi:hypothetical protein
MTDGYIRKHAQSESLHPLSSYMKFTVKPGTSVDIVVAGRCNQEKRYMPHHKIDLGLTSRYVYNNIIYIALDHFN